MAEEYEQNPAQPGQGEDLDSGQTLPQQELGRESPDGRGWRPTPEKSAVETTEQTKEQPKKVWPKVLVALVIVICVFMFLKRGVLVVGPNEFIVLVVIILAILGIRKLLGAGKKKKVVIIGEVRSFMPSSEQVGKKSITKWSFRVERYDRSGNRLQPVQVEMRGKKMVGSINEGEWVEIRAKSKEGQVIKTSKIYNRTAGVYVKAKKGSVLGRLADFIGWSIAFLVIAAIIIGVIILLTQH